MHSSTSQITGILWMIAHCFLISALTAIVRMLSDDFHVFEIVFFHNAVAFVLLLPWALRKGFAPVKTPVLHLHIGRAFLGVIALAMYFYAFTVIPLTQARAIALMGPLVSVVFAVLFLKERQGWHRNIALIIGFLGALVVLQPATPQFSYITLLVIIAVIMWSVIDIIIKMLGRTESAVVQVFYLTGLMALMSLPAMFFVWKPPVSLEQWGWLFLTGVIFLVNAIAISNAFKHADVGVLMPFDFMGMVFTAIIAYLAFDEVIEFWTAIGSVVIVLSSLYIARREMKKSKEPHAVVLQSET